MNYVTFTLIVGVGATAISDIWGVMRSTLFGIPFPNYRLVGRWIGHMKHGRFRHASIAASAPIRGEHILGWTAHYLIGVAFSALLITIGGVEWRQHPTIGLAILVGVGTVAAPFLLMQPGMGAGIAASRTPNPVAARQQSLIFHAVFGLGLYVTAWVTHLLNSF